MVTGLELFCACQYVITRVILLVSIIYLCILYVYLVCIVYKRLLVSFDRAGVAQVINKRRRRGIVVDNSKPDSTNVVSGGATARFLQEDEDLLNSICIYVGIAFNNSHLFLEANREKRKSEALLQLIKAAGSNANVLSDMCSVSLIDI